VRLFPRHPQHTVDPLSEVELRRALSLPGCPLCRLVRESEERFLWTMLYELSGDPEIHRRHSSSLGLCGHHAALLGKLVRERNLITPSGVARLYETLSREAREILTGKELPAQHCYLCSYSRETARRYAGSLAVLLETERSQEIYLSSQGLCFPHLSLVWGFASPKVRQFLQEDMAGRLRDLEERLRELQRKQRYDVHDPLRPEEAVSWQEALWRFGGMEYEELLTSEP